jgi:hypothetical protein
MLAAMVLAAFTVFSAGSMTHGFVAYYSAARLLVSGELGPAAYDDRWFGEKVQQITGSNVREIFTPNPPTMALMALPVAGLDAQRARAAWLVVSLVAFIASVAGLVKQQSLKNRDVSIPVLLVMLLSPAVFTNLRIGQGYLIVFTLSAATALLLIKGRDRAAGVCLGCLLALKMSGLSIAWLLIAKKRWVALGAAALTGAIVVSAITPFIDPRMWIVFPSEVRAFVARPSGSVTAYQTTLSLARHLCIADPRWNPEPAASCEALAFAVPAIVIGLATLVTIVLAVRSTRVEPWIAAGVTLTVLSQPAAAESHFVLLAIPLALLPLTPLQLAAVAFLLIVPLELTAERFTAGWTALVAYPRLYGAWALWGFSIRALVRENPPA